MLIRVFVLIVPALLLQPGAALAKNVKKRSLSDQSVQDQLKLQNANSTFNRPASQPDLRDRLTNQDRIRAFRTRLH